MLLYLSFFNKKQQQQQQQETTVTLNVINHADDGKDIKAFIFQLSPRKCFDDHS